MATLPYKTMSKTQLKKELAQLDNAQLQSLICDIYAAIPEAKEYLDFFCNPDITQLTRKFEEKLSKEIHKGKYGRGTGRISMVRKLLKQFAAYAPDPEHIINLYLFTVRHILVADRIMYLKTPMINGLERLLTDVIAYADKALCLTTVMDILDKDVLTEQWGSRSQVKSLRNLVDLG